MKTTARFPAALLPAARLPAVRLLAAWALLSLAACAGSTGLPQPQSAAMEGWTPASARLREVGLGLPGGAKLAEGVAFAGGLEIVSAPDMPLHSLSDLKLTDGAGGFVTVSDVGDLVRGRIVLDATGRLEGIAGLAVRRLTLADGEPIQEKNDGDAEGLVLLPDGRMLVSFERRHRLWDYGPVASLNARPVPVRIPDAVFGENDGMEGVAAALSGEGWRVTGESGGIWDCTPARCAVVVAPPETPLRDDAYRITGLDRDPSGHGWFVVERSFSPPVDARARVRRMAPDGALGPVLIELKLPGTTDNFEGIAAETRNGRTRLYILSDDNFNPLQRTLMLAFDVQPDRP